MLDCAAVHPPAPLCHGASPPAAAPATLLVPMMAQLWRLDPAPGARRGVRSSGIVVQLFCADPARPEPQADLLKSQGASDSSAE